MTKLTLLGSAASTQLSLTSPAPYTTGQWKAGRPPAIQQLVDVLRSCFPLVVFALDVRGLLAELKSRDVGDVVD